MYVIPNTEKKVDSEILKVYDPVHNDFLPLVGREVSNTAYWVRRLATGDVVMASNPYNQDNKKDKINKKE